MAKYPVVSIIVPCFNSSKNMHAFLSACASSEFKNFEVIVNDDIRTNDDTQAVIESFMDEMQVVYIRKNISMAQGRKSGASQARGKILMHLDSDMEVTPSLIGECVNLIDSGTAEVIVIPEESHGTTFWSKCKWLEKKCYEGVEQIESARCMSKAIYDTINGHNEKMVFSEDKDLDLRLREAGYRFGRTSNHLRHNEGNLKLLKTLQKKIGYSETANVFAEAHPDAYRWQANPLNRYLIFLKNYKYLATHPLVYIGLFVMKTLEYTAAAVSILIGKVRLRA